MLTHPDHSSLANQQESALRSILSGGPLPSRMDSQQVEQAKASLLSKRRREAALSAPHLAAALGDTYQEQFDAYARQFGYPARGGPMADAEAFGTELRRKGLLPADCELENMLLTAKTRKRFQLRRIKGKLIASVRFRGRVRVYKIF